MFDADETHHGVRAVVLALAGVLVALGGWVGWLAVRPAGSVTAAPTVVGAAVNPLPAPEVLVFVSGAVASPGIYRLPSSGRIADAVAAAGGITGDADPGRLPDLAARLHDGRQVNVPFRRGGWGSSVGTGRVDVNAATLDELAAVPGMPQGLPDAIVEYRTQWGPFTTLSQLTSVLGVDRATVQSLRPLLRVGLTTP